MLSDSRWGRNLSVSFADGIFRYELCSVKWQHFLPLGHGETVRFEYVGVAHYIVADAFKMDALAVHFGVVF